jgi:hypothetical protein
MLTMYSCQVPIVKRKRLVYLTATLLFLFVLHSTTVPYKPPQTSFDKLANNQYYKRDVRRSYPVTQVHTANSVKEVKLVTADGASASSTALPPTPGTPVYLNYSRNPSEYPTINNYNWKIIYIQITLAAVHLLNNLS